MKRIGAIATSVFVVMAGRAFAEDAPKAAVSAPAVVTPAACAGKTAIFSDRKTRLFVSRQGTIVEDNPLRPLSSDPLLVLDVVVNGRTATAFGADPETLHRGPAPATLETLHKTKIVWTDAPLPPSFRIVSEDGAVRMAYTFVECSEAPKVAAVPSATARPARAGAASPGRSPRPSAEAPRGFSIPQGAVPEGGSIR